MLNIFYASGITVKIPIKAAVLLFLTTFLAFAVPSTAWGGVFADIAYLSAVKSDEIGDYVAARQKFEKLLKSKDGTIAGHAAIRIGEYYEKGLGVGKDLSKTVEYYKLASQSSDLGWVGPAAMRMAVFHETGIPGIISENRLVAYQWYQRAIYAGFDAKMSIERLQRYPDVYVFAFPNKYSPPADPVAKWGIDKANQFWVSGDRKQAEEIFDWHARSGHADAQYLWYLLLMQKQSVDAKSTARGWVYLAARNGVKEAQREYGHILIDETPAPVTEGMQWLQKAAEQGDVAAENLLGVYEVTPVREWTPHPDKAAEHFRKALEGGNSQAAVNLGDLYSLGYGVQKNDDLAISLWKAAAEAGEASARIKLFATYNIAYNPESSAPSTGSAALPTISRKTFATLSPVELYGQTSPSVHIIAAVGKNRSGDFQGSAVAISSSNVVTNCHVTESAVSVATVVEGKVVELKATRADKKSDLCFYSTDEQLTAVAGVREFSGISVGEKVYAIGSPSGQENTFSEGIVSGLRERDGTKYIQTTAPISPGSSGGGLFDAQGRLIGITTFKIRDAENLNFAVSVDEFRRGVPTD